VQSFVGGSANLPPESGNLPQERFLFPRALRSFQPSYAPPATPDQSYKSTTASRSPASWWEAARLPSFAITSSLLVPSSLQVQRGSWADTKSKWKLQNYNLKKSLKLSLGTTEKQTSRKPSVLIALKITFNGLILSMCNRSCTSSQVPSIEA